MAGKSDITTLKGKSRIAAFKGLRSQRGFAVPPRKAMSLARKKSKGLAYPLPPYAGENLLVLFQWVRGEWKALGKYRRLALPIIALVALTTWEQEYLKREARWDEVEREETLRLANELYAKSLVVPEAHKRRFWPFNRGGKRKD
jgi:hypothetical protein